MTDITVTPTALTCQARFVDPIPGIMNHGNLIYMAGASGVGKTIMLADMLARMRDGRPFCGHPTNRPTDFYYLAADRDWSTYAAAFASAGFSDIKRYVLAEDPEFDPRKWKRGEAFKFLDRCLNILDPCRGAIVIIDPAAPLFVQGSTNDNWDVAISTHNFRRECRQRDISLICTANVVKQKQEGTYTRPQDRIAGSGAFVAYSDTQIYMERDEEGILTFGWVPRMHAPEEFQFFFNTTTRLFEPHIASPMAIGLPQHLIPVLALIPHLPGCITSPDLVRLIMEKRKVKRSMAFKSIQQLLERSLIERDDLGVVRLLRAKQAPVPDPLPEE